MLNEYARAFPSDSRMQAAGFYDDTYLPFYKFSIAWSSLLLENKTLDSNERFICRILSGEIKNPVVELQLNPTAYPELPALVEKDSGNKRKKVSGDIALGAGVWIPTNNLATLGVHPSFTLQLGARSIRDQFDLTIQVRYLSSQNTYVVKKNSVIDSTDYYFGGYVGLDYVHYLVSKKRYEIGVEAGIGFDGFDFVNNSYYKYYNDPNYTSSPSINSFNANAGLRFNYYFSHSFFVGLLGRYNGIHYSTNGGTNLSGDAVSVDMLFGFNGSK